MTNEPQIFTDEMRNDFVEVFEDLLAVLIITEEVFRDDLSPSHPKREQLVEGIDKRLGMMCDLLGVDDREKFLQYRLLKSVKPEGAG